MIKFLIIYNLVIASLGVIGLINGDNKASHIILGLIFCCAPSIGMLIALLCNGLY